MAVSRAPGLKYQAFSDTGTLGSGYKLYTYAAGTVDLEDTFTSSSGLSANTNPIVLNSRGEPSSEIWLTDGVAYKFVLKTAAGVTIWTEDNIRGNESQTFDEWIESDLPPTYLSTTTFSLPGNQTTDFHRGRRLKSTITAGTGFHTITDSAYAAGVTTVTVNGSALDSGLSAVQIGLLSSINSGVPGVLIVGKLTSDLTVAGIELDGIDGLGRFTRTSNPPVEVNRLTTDGTLVLLYKDSGLQGSISVSGATVSYNAFLGSHWAQLQDGSRPGILRGTVLSTIDELCEWPDGNNEKMPKVKISEVAGDPRVYGVFLGWDRDWVLVKEAVVDADGHILEPAEYAPPPTNDMYVASVGTFLVRMQEGQPLQCGLIESAGDGTARFQGDDIFRLSTLGKVTAAVCVETLEDGSFLVPCMLAAG